MKIKDIQIKYQRHIEINILKDDEVFTARDILEMLTEAGYDVNYNQVQNHLNRNIPYSKLGQGHAAIYGNEVAIEAYENHIKKQLGGNNE